MKLAAMGRDRAAREPGLYDRLVDATNGEDTAILCTTSGTTANPKLAMLAAISRDPAQPTTEGPDVTWAARLVEHSIGTLLREADRRVSDNDTEAKHKRLLEIVRDGGRQSRSDITRRSQFLSRREREEILASLIEAGLIVAEQEPSATKPTTFYSAVTSIRPARATEASP